MAMLKALTHFRDGHLSDKTKRLICPRSPMLFDGKPRKRRLPNAQRNSCNLKIQIKF